MAKQYEWMNNDQEFIRDNPELSIMRYGSEEEAIVALKNKESINVTRGVFDAVQQGVWSMNDQINLFYG